MGAGGGDKRLPAAPGALRAAQGLTEQAEGRGGRAIMTGQLENDAGSQGEGAPPSTHQVPSAKSRFPLKPVFPLVGWGPGFEARLAGVTVL